MQFPYLESSDFNVKKWVHPFKKTRDIATLRKVEIACETVSEVDVLSQFNKAFNLIQYVMTEVMRQTGMVVDFPLQCSSFVDPLLSVGNCPCDGLEKSMQCVSISILGEKSAQLKKVYCFNVTRKYDFKTPNNLTSRTPNYMTFICEV